MKIFLYIFLIVICTLNLSAQKNKKSFWDKIFKKSNTKVEFKQVNNNILIPVSLNKSDTLWFILDTGLGTSLITELTPQDSLVINYAKKVKLEGLGSGESLEAYSSFGNDIQIGNIIFKDEKINVLLQDIFFLSKKAGCKINGIIGSTVFENYIVDINYSDNTVEFINPKDYLYKKRKRTLCIPMELIDHKPYINTWITDYKNKRSKVKLLIDTGASLSLWLLENEEIHLPENKIYNILGQGLNGDIHGYIGRIKEIEIGNFSLKEPLVSFPDTSALNSKLQNDNRNGSIGGDLLRRFNIIIDYPNKQICFRKNSKYKKEFLYNNSGLDLETPFPKLKYFMVTNVMENSPASKAGLLVGDQLLLLNDKPAMELDLEKIYKILSSYKEKKIKIKILRDNKEFYFVIITKKLI